MDVSNRCICDRHDRIVIMGLLPNIARDFHVSVSQAGQLITGYALGVAIGGPILVMLTIKLNRKYLLILLMIIFMIGNIAASLSPTYGFMMTSRIITSLAHGSFFGIGSILAASMVQPAYRASAMALMFMGLSLSNILGVPFGTLIGQNFGWAMTFVIIAIIGGLALIGIIIFVPNHKRNTEIFCNERTENLERKTIVADFSHNTIWIQQCICLFHLYFFYTSRCFSY